MIMPASGPPLGSGVPSFGGWSTAGGYTLLRGGSMPAVWGSMRVWDYVEF